MDLFIPPGSLEVGYNITGHRPIYELHWLPIQSRIQFKLCLLVHHVIGGRSQSYISEAGDPCRRYPVQYLIALGGQTRTRRSQNKACLSERAFDVSAPKA